MWGKYYEREPWGEIREDLRAGVIASTIINCRPYQKRNAKQYKPSDLFKSLQPVQTLDDKIAVMNVWAQQHNRRIELEKGSK